MASPRNASRVAAPKLWYKSGVDFGQNLWSSKKDTWEKTYPGVWDHILSMPFGTTVILASTPHKRGERGEQLWGNVKITRSGTLPVRIVEGETQMSSSWQAQGSFGTQWDDLYDLVASLGYDENDERIVQSLAWFLYPHEEFSHDRLVGTQLDFNVDSYSPRASAAQSFQALMRKIDKAAKDMLRADADTWKQWTLKLEEELLEGPGR